MEAIRPDVDFLHDKEWRWPAWKFGLTNEDLFSTLHHQYNTYESPLQDFEAFHHDVSEIASRASSPEVFHQLLAERKQLRLQELLRGFEEVATQLTARPPLLPQDSWAPATAFFGTKSLDSLVAFFASFIQADARIRRSGESAATADEDLSSDTTAVEMHAPLTPPGGSPFEDRPDIKPLPRPQMPRRDIKRDNMLNLERVARTKRKSGSSRKQKRGGAPSPGRTNRVTKSERYQLRSRAVRRPNT